MISSVRNFAEKNTLAELQTESFNTLNIQSANAETYTEKYAVAASMLSRRPDIRNFVKQTTEIQDFLYDDISRLLHLTNGISGSHSIWLVDLNGDVLLHTEQVQSINNFPPQNIATTSYFKTALQGRMGRKSLIINPQNRFYLFASPIIESSEVVGATIILVSLEKLEQTWALITSPILGIDQYGTILLSNIENWRLKKFIPTIESNSTQTNKIINVVLSNKNNGKITTGATRPNQNSRHKKEEMDFMMYKNVVPILEWDLVILQDQQKIYSTVRNYSLMTGLALLLLWLTIWIAWHRNQQTKLERLQQIEFANQLEERVKRRTLDVSIANTQLEKEVEERKTTEEELRKTQKELIQSAKMASIGQMSTVLAHEYNQPISAIQFYAVNAETLLNEKNNEEAIKNMNRISNLTERMAGLTNSLRNFAHKPSQSLKKVNISDVIDQISILMQPRLKAENVELIINPDTVEQVVMAGNTRLTQIISNLIANSIDALKNQTDKQITIEWKSSENGTVIIHIKDNGPGIPTSKREKIYDAFYTTKNNQEGLGLGLFIVFNLINELSGKLSIIDQEGYGAVFCIELEQQN